MENGSARIGPIHEFEFRSNLGKGGKGMEEKTADFFRIIASIIIPPVGVFL